MKKDWATKEHDMHIAQCFIEEYAKVNNSDSLGLFELVVNYKKKRLDFRLSSWVVALASYFNAQYGNKQGDFVTRKVISTCITQDETMH